MNDYALCKQAFKQQCELVVELLKSLQVSDWYKPTRLTGWNVLTLVAHLREAPAGLVNLANNVIIAAPGQNRVSYWQFDGAAVANTIAAAAQTAATTFSPDTAATIFAASLDQALQVLDATNPATVVRLLFGTIELGELLAARLVELVVHCLDLARAVDHLPKLDQTAQSVTVAILTALLDQPRPKELTDDITFIEAVTGRRPYPGLLIPTAFR